MHVNVKFMQNCSLEGKSDCSFDLLLHLLMIRVILVKGIPRTCSKCAKIQLRRQVSLQVLLTFLKLRTG